MKGSPMQRNFGIGESPIKHHKYDEDGKLIQHTVKAQFRGKKTNIEQGIKQRSGESYDEWLARVDRVLAIREKRKKTQEEKRKDAKVRSKKKAKRLDVSSGILPTTGL